jgi:hypothetical protein
MSRLARHVRIVVGLVIGIAMMFGLAMPAIARSPARSDVFCAKAQANIVPDHTKVRKKVLVNAGAVNCSNSREHIILAWRISGPCHPHLGGSTEVILHGREGLINAFDFRPKCAGVYRLAVKAYHRHRLVDTARQYLHVKNRGHRAVARPHARPST